MLQRCTIPNCKKIHHKATYEEAYHMIDILDKAIKNLDQVQAVSEGDKGK